jgi:peptidoglycan biosynthesis protein MviN/MurJ (putative lipid II flippase)
VRIAGLPLGPIGLALGAAVGAWLEWSLLRSRLARRIGSVGAGGSELSRMFGAALVGAAAGYGIRFAAPALHPVITAAMVTGVFGVVYIVVARLLGLAEARVFIDSVRRRARLS